MTKQQKYSCEFCKKTFGQQINFWRHQNKKIPCSVSSSTEKKIVLKNDIYKSDLSIINMGLTQKYFYYWYLCFMDNEFVSSNYKHVVNVSIPIPPISVQQEIVEYLDLIFEKVNKTSVDKILELKMLNELCVNNQVKNISEKRHKETISYLEFNNSLIKQLETEIENNKKQAKLFIMDRVNCNHDNNSVDILNKKDDVVVSSTTVDLVFNNQEEEIHTNIIPEEDDVVVVKTTPVNEIKKENEDVVHVIENKPKVKKTIKRNKNTLVDENKMEENIETNNVIIVEESNEIQNKEIVSDPTPSPPLQTQSQPQPIAKKIIKKIKNHIPNENNLMT